MLSLFVTNLSEEDKVFRFANSYPQPALILCVAPFIAFIFDKFTFFPSIPYPMTGADAAAFVVLLPHLCSYRESTSSSEGFSKVILSIIWIELFLVAAVVGVRRVRSVRSDRTPQTPRTVRTVRTGRLFGGLKSDLRAVVSGLGLAFQQLFALKGSQCPQCFAVLVLEAVAVLNHVLAGRALELPPPFATQLQNVSHGVGELVLLLLFEQGFQLLRGVTLKGPAAGVLKNQHLKVLLTAFGLKQHPLVGLALASLEPGHVDDLAERRGQCRVAT